MTMKHECVLHFLGKLSSDAPVTKMNCIKHLVESQLYISFEEDIRPLIHAAEVLVKNDHKSFPLKEKSFCTQASFVLNRLHARHSKQDQKKFPSFALFLNTKMQ